MKYLVSKAEMKLLDQNTVAHFHVPELVLMEQAAIVFVRELFCLEKSCGRHWERALILCGSGNNGGDGLAVARLLTQQGRRVSIYNPSQGEGCPAASSMTGKKPSPSCQTQREICAAYGICEEREPRMEDYDLIIDALFGTGLSRNVEGQLAELLEQANHSSAWRVALDISSGVSADSGAVLGTCFHAQDTITFSFAKLGQYLWPGNEYSGDVHVVCMGITEESFLEKRPRVAALEKEDLALPKRRAHSNKGTYGRLLVVAGSVGMAGAAVLCARAAYRSGCGLVRVLTAEENRAALQSAVPEAIVTTYSGEVDAEAVRVAVRWADAVVIGPGIGTDSMSHALLRSVMDCAGVPMVLDADALNLIAEEPELLLKHKGKNWVVTPHLGEMARLTGEPVASLQGNLISAAEQFAEKYGVVCVLKDFRTVTAVPGGPVYLNLSGNPGMATAGSGDVLAGILGGLFAQGMRAEDAASGVYLHGLAGDEAAEKCGMRAMTASDLIEGLTGGNIYDGE